MFLRRSRLMILVTGITGALADNYVITPVCQRSAKLFFELNYSRYLEDQMLSLSALFWHYSHVSCTTVCLKVGEKQVSGCRMII